MKKNKILIKLLVLAVIVCIIPILVPNNYIVQVLNTAGIYMILSMGFNILAGYTGQISLGLILPVR